MTIDEALDAMPLVAILRGVKPDEVLPIAQAIYDRGVRCIEVPLNSPDPFESIALLARQLPGDCISGAGTVLTVEEVERVKEAGGQIVVTPNSDSAVIRATIAAGMMAAPGVGTATEAFSAVAAGATHLKLFPASTYGTAHMKALSAVLPGNVRMLAVGGVHAANIAEWGAAGAAGFGIASDIYRAGDPLDVVKVKVDAICTALGR